MIEGCLKAHTENFQQISWPREGSEEWDELVRTWAEAFGEKHAGELKIRKSMRIFLKKPPSFRSEHLPRLLEIVDELNENYAQGPTETIQEDSETSGEKCSMCSGEGLVAIYHRDYQGDPGWEYVEGPLGRTVKHTRVVVPCLCARGRTIFRLRLARDPKTTDISKLLPIGWGPESPIQAPDLPTDWFDGKEVNWPALRMGLAGFLKSAME